MDDLLPPCPDRFQCPITQFRMVDPVIAKDGHSYDREAIQQWFDAGHNTSPKQNNVISTELTPNHGLKTLIQEWVEENTGLNGLEKQLKAVSGPLFLASTPKEALNAIEVISELVTRSKLSGFCVLGPKGVGKIRRHIDMEGNLSKEVTNALSTLEQQCIADVFDLHDKHATILQKRLTVQTMKKNVLGGGDKKLKKDAAATEKKQVSAQKAVDKAKQALTKAEQALKDATAANDEMKKPLELFNKQTLWFEEMERDVNQEEEKIEQNLLHVDELQVKGVEEESSGSSSSSSSSSSSLSSSTSGSKRGRSSSSSSRRSKRQKNELTEEEREEEEEEKHPGQWLYEEGMAYYYGSDFKKEDEERGRMIIEVSASSGFPMAVAYCHFYGWNGLEMDFKKGFEMYLKIEKETNGYHWAQRCLGVCYRTGYGTEEDDDKCFEFETKAAEQGNGLAMHGLGICYKIGQGCEKNDTKSFEWHEKSAQLGDSHAMYWCGVSYKDGTGVTKDVNKAKEWLTKAAAQNNADAREALDELKESEEEEGDWL